MSIDLQATVTLCNDANQDRVGESMPADRASGVGMSEESSGESSMDLVPFARASNELIIKLLGPTVEYVGESWRAKLEKRAQENADRVATLAISKLGAAIELEGSVPPRVLKAILEEAPFCDDEVAAEYVSGVLASARTPSGRDDRATPVIATIGRLSSIALRAHYVFYEAMRRLYRDKSLDLLATEGYGAASTFIPFKVYETVVEDAYRDGATVQHILYNLTREDLITWSRVGDQEYLAKEEVRLPGQSPVEYPDGGFIIQPTRLGVDLYLWSMGRGGVTADLFFEPDFEGFQIPGIEVVGGAQTLGSILSKASRPHLLIE